MNCTVVYVSNSYMDQTVTRRTRIPPYTALAANAQLHSRTGYEM